MCDHTREPTVLSRVSCRPSHLNVDRFHQPCLLPGRTSRMGEDCRPRTTWRPLTFAGSPALPPLRLTGGIATPTRRYHGRMFIHPFPLPLRVPPREQKGARTHAGSGPSRVRRRLFSACLGDPIPLATLFRSLILDHGVLLIISISGPRILISNVLIDTSLHHSFQSVLVRS